MLEGTEYDEYLKDEYDKYIKEQQELRDSCINDIRLVYKHLEGAMHYLQETGEYESNLLDDACGDIKDAMNKVKLELHK